LVDKKKGRQGKLGTGSIQVLEEKIFLQERVRHGAWLASIRGETSPGGRKGAYDGGAARGGENLRRGTKKLQTVRWVVRRPQSEPDSTAVKNDDGGEENSRSNDNRKKGLAAH